MFRKDAERAERDGRIIAESRALLARSYEALTVGARGGRAYAAISCGGLETRFTMTFGSWIRRWLGAPLVAFVLTIGRRFRQYTPLRMLERLAWCPLAFSVIKACLE